MMEWVFKDTSNVGTYMDDVITRANGVNIEELVANHLADISRVSEFMENKLICCPSKSQLFQLEMEFCGRVLGKGVRATSLGKLISSQKW